MRFAWLKWISEVRRHEVGHFQFGFIEGCALQRYLRCVDTAQVCLGENGFPPSRPDQNGIVQPGLPEIGIIQYRMVQNRHRHIGRLRIRLHEARAFQVDAFEIGVL